MPVPNALLATLSPGCDLPRGGRPGRRLPCCWPRGPPSSCWSEPPSAGNRLAEEVNVRAKVQVREGEDRTRTEREAVWLFVLPPPLGSPPVPTGLSWEFSHV